MGYMSPTKGMDFAGVIRNDPYTLSLDVRYIQKSVNRIPYRDDHIVGMSFNDRFTFGKKKYQFDNSSVKDVNSQLYRKSERG